jgi:Zn-dependent protease
VTTPVELAGGVRRCACGTELSAAILACPSCRRLVHRERLETLAAQASRAESDGDFPGALVAWREALDLLPVESSQARVIAERVARTRERSPAASLETAAGPESAGRPWARVARVLASLGAAGLILWKLKFLLVAGLGKAKLALLGLTKLGTLTSMLASFGVYWAAWGWPLAAGLLASIYLHEIGHVARLAQLGMKVDAPMFVPGLGAFVRLRQRPVDAVEDASIGLAGPIWGLGAALVALAAWRVTGSGLALAICRLGAWINLFNLLPVGPLDGGRGFRALARGGRALATLGLLTAYLVTRDGLLLLLVVVALVRTLGASAPASDRRTLVAYLALVGALSALLLLPAAAAVGP